MAPVKSPTSESPTDLPSIVVTPRRSRTTFPYWRFSMRGICEVIGMPCWQGPSGGNIELSPPPGVVDEQPTPVAEPPVPTPVPAPDPGELAPAPLLLLPSLAAEPHADSASESAPRATNNRFSFITTTS